DQGDAAEIHTQRRLASQATATVWPLQLVSSERRIHVSVQRGSFARRAYVDRSRPRVDTRRNLVAASLRRVFEHPRRDPAATRRGKRDSDRLRRPTTAGKSGGRMINTLYLPELREDLAEKNTVDLEAFCSALHPARAAEFMEGLTD